MALHFALTLPGIEAVAVIVAAPLPLLRFWVNEPLDVVAPLAILRLVGEVRPLPPVELRETVIAPPVVFVVMFWYWSISAIFALFERVLPELGLEFVHEYPEVPTVPVHVIVTEPFLLVAFVKVSPAAVAALTTMLAEVPVVVFSVAVRVVVSAAKSVTLAVPTPFAKVTLAG